MQDELKPESSRRHNLPLQRWQIYPQKTELARKLGQVTNMPPLINQLLINRGFDLPDTAEIFLNPQSLNLPEPLEEFPDLAMSVDLLQNAIANQEKIAICGDYDADGMTSTALLLRSLRTFGADVDYAIPSRMHEGYGINKRIIEEFDSEGVGIILTVDNGISAFEPIARAKELGLKTIITDHHDIPQKLPPADAILNPKLLPESSVYRGVAGVGVAYILAMSLAEKLGRAEEISDTMLELFALGTIADLAPLVGVNRTWVKRGLRLLPKSQLAGIQALIQMAGVQALGSQGAVTPKFSNSKINNPKSLKPDDIGFRLGPRINAIGRIGDPQIVIELLTTDDVGIALERAMQCEATNASRREMCEEIEKKAIEVVETEYLASLKEDRVLVVVQPDWHHGVIGIVASRLVERYGVPVFIGTYEDDNHIRGSARGIPEFNVFDALQYCDDYLGKYGGHKAAGGFSLPAENLQAVRQRLSEFANQCLELQHLKPLLKIDALANINEVNRELYQQINALEPCGIDNPNPVFWTPNVQVVEQQIVGKGHIKLTVAQAIDGQQHKIKGIAWRWRDYFPLPKPPYKIDIAYKLKENNFNGNTSIELEVLGVRLADSDRLFFTYKDKPVRATFVYSSRQYICGIYQKGSSAELRIKSPENKVLAVQSGHNIGLLGINREQAQKVDISQSPYYDIIQAALKALKSLKS
ncbi:single-stranded-DNA-specific exonuclease RecJ [Rivularia sp. PCC 7116]|uniref:single-stranded-DNA-specific exonuclease RecJ n=1 Tax=Rivularia sp. PCC 7116 TaxID=373994 RepID=UPI00029F46CC|nr:single-stranded-DNA-specific exonuclease RecJ [Rivularia sp. PCC 7116]AFY59131.1 single-stranded-DNA-specific exonuclease RecJ [Rivularia sp. PCC 7116]